MLRDAVILCGGRGTRLGTQTGTTPKPLLEVGGRPFLFHLIQEVARFGVSRIILIAGFLGEMIRAQFDGMRIAHCSVEVLIEAEPSGTAGALRLAGPRLEEDFLLLNGDSWIDLDLVAFARHWQLENGSGQNFAAQLALRVVDDVSRFGSVSVNRSSNRLLVTKFVEKQSTLASRGLVNAGVYVLSPALLRDLPQDRPISLETTVLPNAASRGLVAGYEAPTESFFIDIGVPESLRAAREQLLSRRTRPALFVDRDGTLNEDRGYTHDMRGLVWMPGAREAIATANAAGWFVFVVTNQAGIAHGYYEEHDVQQFHRAMQAELFHIGAHVDAFEFCPFHPEARIEKWRRRSPRRKPAPGMINDLMAQWPIDAKRSVMIGNSVTYIEAGEAAGIRGILYQGGSLAEVLIGAMQGASSHVD
ncbi:HAD-IIIA family hydrolase [Aestuariivirga sp.]|uniref:HAD-IIIA family hydrolase n=1 Tax=Aestuariivirga sp. TaxID=2650926 RepID=UPI0039E63F26